ncbi:zinc-dependent metalloprotease [Pedobacter deserti]|uniref:zinc-dependent metalloprotease n=1 Tax=Pedobacter deserti TaxID=2817382 RepID=UPI00210E7748|nr:zinc-dependent metalloprotease [Pedobacter sp. SYSU D00382]
MKKNVLLTLLGLASAAYVNAQDKPATPPAKPAAANPNAMNRPAAPTNGPKPYKQVITDSAKTDHGLFKVHQVQDRYYFEIADSLLGREILTVNRISKAAAGNRASMMGYGGDHIGDNVISFEKGPANKIFIRTISYGERSADSTEQGMYRSLMSSNIQPLVASFDIKALANDSVTKVKGSVIDVTDYMNGDNEIFFFESRAKRALSLSNQLNDRSYIREIKSYPTNIEIRTVKTYTKTPAQIPGMPPAMAGSPTPVTYELNSSMVLLPKKQMKPRFFDARVGYFATGYVDFDSNPQGIKNQALITRWRLEPKPEDVERYKRGELVEPKKQIVYYIDPATPKKWIPYLIQGVNDWQKAFEQAGFKNAIVAKLAPNDPNWSIDDARHSVIVYKPSDIPNASGPHVHDPRTGEILETHINWYHNIMQLVRNWYIIQAAAIDPGARKMKFDDKLMGELIRFVSSHEVGHTLGLRHNFGSSATVPVEKLRDKQWVEKNGHTPSIMDYARFNYVAQPEDKISAKGIFPRIGDYDMWAIEWGYKWLPQYKTAEDESKYSNQTIIKRIAENPRLAFGTETDPNDPRNQSEDLGDNAVLASEYGIKNLKRLVPNILAYSKEPNEGYDNAKALYGELVGQFGRYIGHVAKYVGGIYATPKTMEESGTQYSRVNAARQKQAMDFLGAQVFNTPKWLLDKNLLDNIGEDPISVANRLHINALARLVNANTFNKLISAEAADGPTAYKITDLFSDLQGSIFSELKSNTEIDVYRRNLQKTYVNTVISLLEPPAPAAGSTSGRGGSNVMQSDAVSLAKAQLRELSSAIKSATPAASGMSKFHLEDLSQRIDDALKGKG